MAEADRRVGTAPSYKLPKIRQTVVKQGNIKSCLPSSRHYHVCQNPQCPKIMSAKEQADCSAHKDLVQTKDSLSSRGLPERFEDAAKKAKICKAKRKIQK